MKFSISACSVRGERSCYNKSEASCGEVWRGMGTADSHTKSSSAGT